MKGLLCAHAMQPPATRAPSSAKLYTYQAIPKDTQDQPSLDRRILSIAVPSLLALSLDPVLTTVDTAFVGRLPKGSSIGLAALGLSFATFGLIYTSTNFFSNVATPLVAERRDYRLAVGISVTGLSVGIALCLAVEACAPLLVRAVGGIDQGEVFDAALSFARIRALSAPAVAATNALNGCLRGLGDVTSPLRAAIAAAVVNLVLDYFLVPRLGANGAAIATAAAETIGALSLVLALATYQQDDVASDQGALELSSLFPFAKFAAFTLIRSISLQLFLAVCTNYIGSTGSSAALAANHTLRSLYTLLSFATDALAVAAQQLIASAEPKDRRPIATRLLAVWGLGIGTAFALALAIFADPIVATVDVDPAVRALAAPLVRNILAPLQVLSSLVFVADGILQGNKAFGFEAKAMMLSSLLAAAALYLYPELYTFPAGESADSVLNIAWHAVCVLQLSRALTFLFWWLRPPDSSPSST